jgi:hypothetical protein
MRLGDLRFIHPKRDNIAARIGRPLAGDARNIKLRLFDEVQRVRTPERHISHANSPRRALGA